jgi:hypothetical protein
MSAFNFLNKAEIANLLLHFITRIKENNKNEINNFEEYLIKFNNDHNKDENDYDYELTDEKRLNLLLNYIIEKSEEDVVFLNLLGDYYCEINNEEKMVKYFDEAIKKNYKVSAKRLAIYYEQRKNFDKMEEYIDEYIDIIYKESKEYVGDDKEIFEKKSTDQILEIIRYAAIVYKNNEQFDQMAIRLKLCVDDFNDVISMVLLADYYRYTKNILEMHKYYAYGIANNCKYCALNYGLYFYSIKEYNEMLRCYDTALKLENKHANYQLYIYYSETNNKNLAKKYYDAIINDRELMKNYYYIDKEENLFKK